MSTLSKGTIGRLFTEFVVIVLGVMVALAVDRAASAVDRRDAELALIEALQEDFTRNREIAMGKLLAEQRTERRAREVLTALDDPDSVQMKPDLFLSVELSSWQIAAQYQRGAWEDLTTIVGADGLRDAPLRRALAEFYTSVEATRRYESEWLTYLLEYRKQMRAVMPPAWGIAVVESYMKSDGEVQTADLPQLPNARELIDRMAQNPKTAQSLGDVIQARMAWAWSYEHHIRLIDSILGMIEDRADAL